MRTFSKLASGRRRINLSTHIYTYTHASVYVFKSFGLFFFFFLFLKIPSSHPLLPPPGAVSQWADSASPLQG